MGWKAVVEADVIGEQQSKRTQSGSSSWSGRKWRAAATIVEQQLKLVDAIMEHAPDTLFQMIVTLPPKSRIILEAIHALDKRSGNDAICITTEEDHRSVVEILEAIHALDKRSGNDAICITTEEDHRSVVEILEAIHALDKRSGNDAICITTEEDHRSVVETFGWKNKFLLNLQASVKA